MNSSLNLINVFAVGLGASIGAWVRWGFNALFNHVLPNMPLGTLVANLTGGLIMGAVISLVGLGHLESTYLRLLITTGFLGGLTTFSAFTGESLLLLQKQEYIWATVHISSHLFGALLMAVIGFTAVQYFRT